MIDVQELEAKAAGVQVFVPSEFGGLKEGLLDSLLGVKGALHVKRRGESWAYRWCLCTQVCSQISRGCVRFVLLYFRLFLSLSLLLSQYKIVNLHVTSGKVAVGGDGNLQVSFTMRSAATCFLAYVLIHVPKAQLQNQSLRLEVLMRYIRLVSYLSIFAHQQSLAVVQ